MQFNPTCLSSGVLMGTSPHTQLHQVHAQQQHQQHQQHQQPQPQTPPTTPQQQFQGVPHSPHQSPQHTPIAGPPPEFLNSLPFNDTNNWSTSPLFNGISVYGTYNSNNGFIAATPEVSPSNIPIITNQVNDPKQKSPMKRQGSCDDIAENDKNQGMDEEQRMKRQRRLVKNREAAQQFRQRQKEYIQNLEHKVLELNNVVQDNHKHIELLNTENRLLRDQMVYLYNVMRQNITLPPSSPTTTSSSFNPLQAMFPSLPTTSNAPPPPPPPAGMLDLGTLGFKGFNVVDPNTQFEELMKATSHTPPAMQLLVPSPAITPSPTPNGTPLPSPSPSPTIARIPADMAAMSISNSNSNSNRNSNNSNNSSNNNNNNNKAVNFELCAMTNPLLVGRLGANINKTGEYCEPQTVPDLIIKTEGHANM